MIYRNEKIKNISFPLGGIGTGCIGLAGNGGLVDWEIFNRQNKNTFNGYSHFAIKVRTKEGSLVKVLQGDTTENLMGMHDHSDEWSSFGFGPHKCSMAGYPHFKNTEFESSFPFATVRLWEEGFPIKARLRAFNPFIPHDEYNSSLPAAFFEWEIETESEEPLEFDIAFSIQNPAKSSVNEAVSFGDFGGVFFKNAAEGEDSPEYFDLCILTDSKERLLQPYWYRGKLQDSSISYWRDFCGDSMPERRYANAGRCDHGTVVARGRVSKGEKRSVRFILAWNMPTRINYWDPIKGEDGKDLTWKNYYATQFKSSAESAAYSLGKFDELKRKSEAFSEAIECSTLPEFARDAVSANLSVLKTPTVLRMEDGSLWGWEGGHELSGSCEGSCQHVWNYAYALPFLFPRLERSLRENTIKYALDKNGASHFRVTLPLGREKFNFRPCVDGQMGEVIKVYREWKLSGDTEWLKRHAAAVFSMLEYAWSPENYDKWDMDKDGVLEGRQHHTLDLELFGPSSWLQGMYLLALDCGSRMAEALGDHSRAKEYRDIYEKGKRWTNEHLFNGRYFHQQVDIKDKSVLDPYEFGKIFIFDDDEYWNEETEEIKYQIAEGCIIDQMLGDWHSALVGAEEIFDEAKKKTALLHLFKYNFKPSMREVVNTWRNFAINDEAGTVICSYPEGVSKPTIPISYCEECMTGFEYALAGLMLRCGFTEEGETIVRAVRERYDGERRNPWNEIECGSNYARSMASYALMPIYSGFSFDMTRAHLGFAPLHKNGRFLFSVADSWGRAEFCGASCRLTVLGNPLELRSVTLPEGEMITRVTADGKEIAFELSEGEITFSPVRVSESLILE